MSNLVEIKKRIESISSTIKVTKVMHMIATAKIAKIKNRMNSTSKYESFSNNILNNYLNNTNYKLEFQKYCINNGKKRILFLLFSSDKGTCGGINTNIFKEMVSIIKKYKEQSYSITILPIGKKAKSYVDANAEKMNFDILKVDYELNAENCDSLSVNKSVKTIIQAYNDEKYSEINFIYHKFKNIITCNVVNEQLLPLDNSNISTANNVEFTNIIESENTLSAIIEFFIRTKLYNAYISNIASIISSRMNAMDNATKNGQEIIDDLKIKYNKGRQANITSELSDIVSGFEAIS